MKILDIHTHNLSSNPNAIIDLSARIRHDVIHSTFNPDAIIAEWPEGQPFSAGIHPWDLIEGIPDGLTDALESMIARPEIVLVGEGGVDNVKGGPLFRQMTAFKHLIDLSEKYKKPLLIHDVKAHDIIIGLHRDLKPTQQWVIHGFRQKPSVAEMMLREGFLLSFGPDFNALTLRSIPTESMLAETDNSGKSPEEVIRVLSDAKGYDLTDTIAANAARLIGSESLPLTTPLCKEGPVELDFPDDMIQ